MKVLSHKELDALLAEHECERDRRVRFVTLSFGHVPWFLADILAYLSGRAATEFENSNNIDGACLIIRQNDEELGWFMTMSYLGDMFSKDET